jgi:hypothetical protein
MWQPRCRETAEWPIANDSFIALIHCFPRFVFETSISVANWVHARRSM